MLGSTIVDRLDLAPIPAGIGLRLRLTVRDRSGGEVSWTSHVSVYFEGTPDTMTLSGILVGSFDRQDVTTTSG